MAPSKDVEKNAVLKDTQSHADSLSTTKRVLIVTAVSFTMFLSFLDQTAVTTAVPSVAASLHIGSSITWVTASFLAASTSTQLIVGRLSDIFGRKATLVGALSLLMCGELLTGFARNEIWLYACRAVAGLGAGSLGSQAQIVISDVTTVAQRGKYMGIAGTAIALGNGLGPVIGGLLTQNVGWRWVFWIMCPLAATSIVIMVLVLPGSGRKEDTLSRLKMVDWFGVLMTLAGTFLVLIPISQGGSSFPFNSAEFIALLTVGLVVFIVTFYAEAKWVKLPVIPLYLFRGGYGVNAFLWQNVGLGWIYFANLYFTPQYFQNIRGFSPSRSGVLLLPLVVTHGVSSAVSGNLISRSGRYIWAVALGTGVWTVGLACQAAFYGQDTGVPAIALIGVFEGIGVGFSLQTNILGLLANTYKRDRAVGTALRAFLRAIGGAVGIAVSNAILNNTLKSGLQGLVPDATLASLSASIADLPALGLDDAQQRAVRDVYMRGIHNIFLTYAPIMAITFLIVLPVRDRGLSQLDEREKPTHEHSGTSTQVEPEPADARALEVTAATTPTEKAPGLTVEKAAA